MLLSKQYLMLVYNSQIYCLVLFLHLPLLLQTATDEAAHSRKPTIITTNREIKITANLKRTCIDADF